MRRCCNPETALLLQALVIVTCGCGHNDDPSGSAADKLANEVQRDIDRDKARTASVKLAPLDEEAIKRAWELFRDHWTQCGDSWLSLETSMGGFRLTGSYSKEVVELKEPAVGIPAEHRPPNEADKLNGIEWTGWLEFTFAAARTYPLLDTHERELHGPWTDWWTLDYRPYRVHLAKKRGTWIALGPQVVGNNFFVDPLGGNGANDPKFAALGCEDVKALTRGASAPASTTVEQSRDRGDALQVAAMNGNIADVQAALSSGADVNMKWNQGCHETALIGTIKEDVEARIKIVEMLLKAGANVNLEDGCGKTPLTQAVMVKATRITKLLLAHGADVNKKMPGDVTALHIAASDAPTELVQVLLDAGADVNAKGGGNVTASKIAKAKHREDVVALLKKYGATD